LSFETTVAEWRDACDLIRTDGLGAALNEMWQISVPLETWQSVLEPAKRRTLREVCDAIASCATQPVIRPEGALGSSCAEAGAFLAVRTILLRAGAEPALIRPSLPIAEIARRHPEVFLGAISRLAPGRLPQVTIRSPLHHRVAVWAIMFGLVAALAAAKAYPLVALGALSVVVLATVAIWALSRVPPREVRFGGVVTFRHLAEAIAREPAV
jgi:hypothetical protein